MRTLFSSINYELFRVINISICSRKRVVHITESDVGANENLYIKKKRDVENHVSVVTYGNE